MRGSLKVIICFQTRIEKYIEENNLPPKLSLEIYTQLNSTKKSFHVPSSSPQNQTSWFKIAIIGDKNITTTSIYLAVQTLYNSAKPLGAALKKPRLLL